MIVGIDIDGRSRSPGSSVGKLRPTVDDSVGIVLGVTRRCRASDQNEVNQEPQIIATLKSNPIKTFQNRRGDKVMIFGHS